MHAEAFDWVWRHGSPAKLTLLDLGGRDINGSAREAFPNAVTTVLDVREGLGVDVVADAATWTPDGLYDVVLCTEVFEHTPDWPDICETAYTALCSGGRFLATMAGPGRAPHSAIDEQPPRPDEFYRNVEPDQLTSTLLDVGFTEVFVDVLGLDVRCVAQKP